MERGSGVKRAGSSGSPARLLAVVLAVEGPAELQGDWRMLPGQVSCHQLDLGPPLEPQSVSGAGDRGRARSGST